MLVFVLNVLQCSLGEKEKMRKKIEAAYREAAKEDYETYKEWEDTLKDGIEDDIA